MSQNRSPDIPACLLRKRADLIQALWEKKQEDDELKADPDRFRKLRRYDPQQKGGGSHHLNKRQICRELEGAKPEYNTPKPASSAEYVCRKRRSEKHPYVFTRAQLWQIYNGKSDADKKALATQLQEEMQDKHNIKFKQWSAQREALFPYYVMCPIITGRQGDKVIEMPPPKASKASKARRAGTGGNRKARSGKAEKTVKTGKAAASVL